MDDNCGEAQPMYNTCQLRCYYGVYLKVFFSHFNNTFE